MLADELDYVVGVDTHRDQHVLAVVVVPTGAVVAQRSVPATTHGYAAALRFADEFAPGRRSWAIEGAGHYGAGIARHLTARNELVHESVRSTRAERRLRGKDGSPRCDSRSALGHRNRHSRRSPFGRASGSAAGTDGRPAKRSRRRRVALVQLRSVVVTAPETLRQELRLLSVTELVRRCSRFRRSSSRTPDYLATILALRSLAQRIQAATHEPTLLEREILAHVRTLAPELLDERGRRTDRRRAADRELVAQGPRPL
jgi:transposase